ncbi:MAG: hypothetical protein GY745_02285 [Actinomycetia bacterium]|nr:hypothetical protein [Actinomycetes bacterium]MCP3909697.1 hypothetical protein [Actinomycetes bacterium]MCP4083878.1 hypothetical protein [Actinomycetes bacterium]
MSDLGGSAFDFWLGEWNCTFDGGTATNSVTRDFDGQVVTERFEGLTPQRWSGMSVSVYNEKLDLWRQTWVDQSGAYWHFVGSLVGGNPSFGTPEPVDVERLFKRMVFSNIASDGFDWRWESSPDGESWTENWAITYLRQG